MSLDANNINGMLQVYAFESIPAFAADLPPINIFTSNFSSQIADVGTSVHTRIATNTFGNLNDLANGWEKQAVSSSDITATLKMLGHDEYINVTQWDTIGEAQLLNTFGNILGKQVANGLCVQLYNQVTSSYYTTTVTTPSSSLFSAFGVSSSLAQAAVKLDNNEIPIGDRYCIMTPNLFQAMVSNGNVYQYLTLGDQSVIRDIGYKTKTNSAALGHNFAGFDIYKSPRLTGASVPYGGDKYSGNDKLVGFAGRKEGLVVAARAPSAFNVPGVYSYVAQESTSGFPFLFGAALDVNQPAWRFFIYTLIGTAQGNQYGIVPILTQST